ncbi:MAG TPA: NADPH:quinone oxidoreductase family protein [Burkholderiaceae bacterium]|nr:NADPH:quinone oxidoreductase family protein [Burkholderiaceae bacterium]
MKALRCVRHGLPDTLVVEDIDAPLPGPGQVLVQVKAAGVNFPDTLIIQDKYQFKPALPFTPGGELAGIVAAVGEGVTRVAVGQRVIGFVMWGAFAEQALVAQDQLVPMPEGMPFDVASAFLMTYGTCYHALHDRAQLRDGEVVLVLGAAGGIGIASIEIAKARGAKVIAAASSEDKLAVCRERGADMTINYQTEDLRERLKALTGGRGVDVVVDPVGGRFTEPALRGVAWRGRYLVVGFTDGEIARVALNLPLLKGCSIVGVFYGDFLKREPAHAEADVRALFDLYREKKIAPLVSARYDLEHAGQAIEALMQRRVRGKVVVTP